MSLKSLLFTSLIVTTTASQPVMAARLPGTSIEVKPALDVTMQQDDNVYFREDNAVSDSSVILNPRFDVNAELGASGDSMALRADFRRENYASETRLDNDEYDLRFDGVKAITRRQRLLLEIGAEKHVDGANGANSFGDQPDTVEQRAMSLAYLYRRGSVPLRIEARRTSYRYQRLTASGENDDLRDRDEVVAQFRIGYAPTVDRELYARIGNGKVISRSEAPEAAMRDASLQEWAVGYRFRKEAVIDLEAALGIYSLQYDDGVLDDVDEPVHLLRAAFPLTPLTTLHFRSSKRFEMTRLAGSPGYGSLENRLLLEHAFGRRIRLGLFVARGTDTFVDSEIEDQITEQGVQARYRFGRHWVLHGSATQESRERSRVSIGSEDRSTVDRSVLSLGLRYEL